MDTGICVWFYQEVFTGTEINLHSANQYTVNCYLHSQKKYCKISQAFLQGV